MGPDFLSLCLLGAVWTKRLMKMRPPRLYYLKIVSCCFNRSALHGSEGTVCCFGDCVSTVRTVRITFSSFCKPLSRGETILGKIAGVGSPKRGVPQCLALSSTAGSLEPGSLPSPWFQGLLTALLMVSITMDSSSLLRIFNVSNSVLYLKKERKQF